MNRFDLLKFALLLWAGTLFKGVESQGTCTKIDACSCTYGDNQVVDLTPIAGNPRFADQYDPSYISMYSYNPCKPFSEGTCNNVAVCQYNGADYYECGSQDSAVFLNDPTSGALQVQYSSTDSSGTTRTSQVTLTCIQSGDDTLTVQGETTTGYYVFDLSSVHCCPRSGPAPSGGGSSSGGLSIGSILVIVFFALVIVYFIGGTIFLKFGRKAAGTEAIPNRAFWGAIPGLIKDGTLFVVRRGKKQEYGQI